MNEDTCKIPLRNDKLFEFFNRHVNFDYIIEINIMLDFVDYIV